jgi:hypothetical protein
VCVSAEIQVVPAALCQWFGCPGIPHAEECKRDFPSWCDFTPKLVCHLCNTPLAAQASELGSTIFGSTIFRDSVNAILALVVVISILE